MKTPTITIQCFESSQQLEKLKSDWDELHQNCTMPSIYNSFHFIYNSIKSFTNKDVTTKIFTLTDNSNNQLLAVFPMQHIASTWYIFKVNTYEYTALDETDKPYPLIRNNYLQFCWQQFLQHLKDNVSNWDHLQLIEMPFNNLELKILPDICKRQDFIYRARPVKQGPIIKLNGDWEDYWNKHKKMRKKISKINKDFGGRLAFKTHTGNWNKNLDQYIELEQKSWKKGKVGISKNAQTEIFYRRLFESLDQSGNLIFGFLTLDDTLISAEIAYTHNDTVYFCHGCFDPAYNKYSPGMVSTSLFLKYFFGENYINGDFLCGYAGYLNDWSETILQTYKIDIYNKRLKIRSIFGLRIFIKLFITPALRLSKLAHEKFKPVK